MLAREIKEKNKNSVINLLPEEHGVNRGFLFYQLPHILMINSGIADSKSGVYIKLAKLMGVDIGADSQFIRKIKDDSATDEDIEEFFKKVSSTNLANSQSLISTDLPSAKNIGGWAPLKLFITGLQVSNKIPELADYLDFLIAICDIEKELFNQAANANETPFKQADIAEPWLNYSEGYRSAKDWEKQTEYHIALILHWTALFEHFIILTWPELVETKSEYGSPFTFGKYIPKMEEGKTIYSANIFLERFKEQYGKATPQSKSTWRGLYDNIRRNDPKNPDSETIEKQFKRWKRGTKMTVRSFGKLKGYMIALMRYQSDFDEEDAQHSFFHINSIITFIQVFDNVQRYLVDKKVRPEFVVDQFARYPLYLEMVSNRFNRFCKTGIVAP